MFLKKTSILFITTFLFNLAIFLYPGYSPLFAQNAVDKKIVFTENQSSKSGISSTNGLPIQSFSTTKSVIKEENVYFKINSATTIYINNIYRRDNSLNNGARLQGIGVITVAEGNNIQECIDY